MAEPDIRFTIDAAGQQAVFLSVVESKTGKLRLILKAGKRYKMEMEQGSEISQRYSIHDSENSEKYNTIHYTTLTGDDRKTDVAQLTDAIKSKTGFAYLCTVASSDMGLVEYKLGKIATRTKIICIDSYDPKLFTFCYGIAIGSRDTAFITPTTPAPMTIQQWQFKRFSLVLMWSYATLHSCPFVSMAHTATIDPKVARTSTERDALKSLMIGLPAAACVLHFHQIRQELMMQQLSKLDNYLRKDGINPTEEITWLLSNMQHVQRGDVLPRMG